MGKRKIGAKSDSTEEKGASSNTLFIRNLPYTATNEKLEEVFSEYGPVKSCFVVGSASDSHGGDGDSTVSEKKPGKSRGFGYVKFSLRADAEKAVAGVKAVAGRQVFVSFARKKAETATPGPAAAGAAGKSAEKSAEKSAGKSAGKSAVKSAVKSAPSHEMRERIVEARKKEKENKETQLNRLIVRNLSFKCTELQLKNQFTDFGQVREVTIPVMDDGKKRGFAFVQMMSRAGATAAIQALNMAQIAGRPVAVDWALSKDKYIKFHPPSATSKPDSSSKPSPDKKSDSSSDDDSDESKDSDDDGSGSEMQGGDSSAEEESGGDESDSDEGDEASEMSSDSDDDDDGVKNGKDIKDSDDSESDSDDDDDDEDSEEDEPAHKKVRDGPSDVEEGKTLFIRNLSFESTEEELTTFFSKYGVLLYAKVVTDHLTDHSKGMGFIKFKEKSSADACLAECESSPADLTVRGRQLNITVAVSREAASKLAAKKKEEKEKNAPKDTRNLALLREGVIRAGTDAAESLSKEDLAKRQKIENISRQKIKNPNILVSTTRIIVHNLPTSATDKELKAILLKAAGKGAQIKECRIMRDLHRLSAQGVGRSRGYAFAEFTEQEHALAALRSVNNDASLFGADKRLIVQFSLENKVILEKKRKQQMKSKDESVAVSAAAPVVSKANVAPGGLSKVTKQGTKRLFPSHSGPKVRHTPRPATGRAAGGKQKPKKAQPTRKREKKMKPKGKPGSDGFDKLVQKYKKNLQEKKKWFD